MTTKLKHYFPILWEKKELLRKIRTTPTLSAIFDSWTFEQQEEFINFCTGVKGIKFLYDGFFKEIMNPEYTPERLNEFLSLLLNKKVTVHMVLPNDSTRIADESSLLVTDIVVELEDGSLANVEVQKIGYHFPGQRSACYSADMLLRQYKRTRALKKEKFTYRDIKDVYTIILFEKSTSEFHAYPNTYLHYFEHDSNTGLKLPLLQKFIFVSLDIFLENQHNKSITNKLDAWLLLFSSDRPEDIIRLIEEYPEFQAIYEQAYHMCRNVEDIMGFFSEELRILDRNTVQYMMDEIQEDLDRKKAELSQTQEELDEVQEALDQTKGELDQTKGELDQTKGELDQTKSELAQALKRIKELEANNP